jgi:ferritin-like protein
MAMKITTSISINVEGESEALRERVLELAQQEIMRYSAALADRLEEEGIEDVTIGIEGDE